MTRLSLMVLELLAGAALIILILLPAFAQEAKKPEREKPWTGKLADGRVITRADLDQILQDHKLWLESDGKKGKKADLARAYLRKAKLNGAILWWAKLTGASISDADLSGAELSEANLSGAELNWADQSRAFFEPKPGTLSDVTLSANIRGLSSLNYNNSPQSLVELRESYKKAGMRDEKRQVTYALNNNRRVRLWEIGYFKDKSEYDKNQDFKSKLEKLMAKVESIFQLVCFELPCGYGLYPGRPLKIIGLGLLFFIVPYIPALGARKQETGLWVVLLPDRVLDKNIKDKPIKRTFENPFLPPSEGRGIGFRSFLPRFLRVLWMGLHFSLISAFNLGWREINVGNWITRIQKREYTLRATGWMRSVAGIQSLLSFYMLALWVLSYFGRPFD